MSGRWWVALGALAALAAAVVARMRWDSASDWALWLIALGGFALTVITFWRGVARDRTEGNRARRAQADKVHAWGGEMMWVASTPTRITAANDRPTVTEFGQGPIVMDWIDLNATNASDMPVHGFRFEFFVSRQGAAGAELPAGFHDFGTLLPGAPVEFRLTADPELRRQMGGVIATLLERNLTPPQLRVGYRFTDHAQVRWHRDMQSGVVVEDAAQ